MKCEELCGKGNDERKTEEQYIGGGVEGGGGRKEGVMKGI